VFNASQDILSIQKQRYAKKSILYAKNQIIKQGYVQIVMPVILLILFQEIVYILLKILIVKFLIKRNPQNVWNVLIDFSFLKSLVNAE
jgi:hypothetical protein